MAHTDDLLEPDEAELHDLFVRTMGEATAPAGLASHAVRRGRRLRARRRAGLAAGATAACAVAALVVPTVMGGSAPAQDPSGPTDSATEPAPPTESPSAPAPMPAGWWDMPSRDMVATVEAILPDGVVVTNAGPLTADDPEGGPGSGWIAPVLQASSGPGRLNVMLYPAVDHAALSTSPGEGGEPDRLSCEGESLMGNTRCDQVRNAADQVVGRRLVNRWGGTVMHEVVLRRGNGIVYAAAANTTEVKWGAHSTISAEQPPLTLDQLEAVVRNDAWVRPAG